MPVTIPKNKLKLLKELNDDPGFASFLLKPGGLLDKPEQKKVEMKSASTASSTKPTATLTKSSN